VRLVDRLTPLLLVALVTACGGGADDRSTGSAVPSGAAPAAASTVPLTGRVIEITMHTDDKGNYFLPARIEAAPGDLLRFKLATGVHNVNFLADSNAGRTGLPAPSAFLQLPGQTYDVPLTFGTGHFYFQCDPHALLGMVARLEVEDDEHVD
jgi:plastocyanin